MRPKIIAFYLPQYHPTPNNDKWWGTGFTEWTNVGKAKPLYKGHYQPKVPADLGYYDLRLPEVREQQAQLAVEAGLAGFCYYHYWFENGKEELDRPFKEVIESGSPNFPFCLCWANESWHSKFWNVDGTIEKKLLVEQKYLGSEDNESHFYSLLKAFRDQRYMRIKEKLIFVIYSPTKFPNVHEFIEQWQNLARENGLKGFYFIGYSLNADREYDTLINLGFDGVCSCRIGEFWGKNIFKKIKSYVGMKLGYPRIYNYSEVYPKFVGDIERKYENVFPTLVPNWDHTPRSGKGGYLYHNSTPELFQKHAEEVMQIIKEKQSDTTICFLKSWNEWGEGNYMEPDLRFGKGFIKALRNAILKYF